MYAMGVASAQTVYRCPDANGRLSMQDTPCQGGTAVRIKSASGTEPASTTGRGDIAGAPMGTAASLKASVGLMEWERKGRELGYQLRDAKNERARLDAARDAEINRIQSEVRVTNSQLSADLFAQQQLARITNVRLDYQSRVSQQDSYIKQLEADQAAHQKADPRIVDKK